MYNSCQSGHSKVTKFLVENGANIHAMNDYALRWGSINGHLQVVNYLTERMNETQ